MNATRKIFKSATAAQSAVRDVLAALFTQELLLPSRDVFVVAPWISNVVVFDNRVGQFASLNPEWARREIRFIEVLVALCASGGMLHVHTRPDPHNQPFLLRLQEALADMGVADRCSCRQHERLHTKGLLTDRVLIDGSMNITESGVAFNDEAVTISFNAHAVASARVHFETYEHR
jgi:hypothetical protein